MPRLLSRPWWAEFGYKLSIRVATRAAAPWLLALGAGIVSAVSYGLERSLFDYHQLPAHAQLLIPTFSASLGFSLVLALTFFLREKNLFQRTGFRRAFPVREYGTQGGHSPRYLAEGVGEIKRLISETPEAGRCRLLLVSGFFYIGAPALSGSPHHLLDDLRIPGRLRILLLNPYREMCTPFWWAGLRATEADPRHRLKPEKYAAGIDEVCAHLIALRDDDNINLEIGFYNFWPSWQLFLNDREGIVQPVSVGRHSQYNPMYHFQYTRGSLFVPFQRYFEVIWQRWEAHREEHRPFYEGKGILKSAQRGVA